MIKYNSLAVHGGHGLDGKPGSGAVGVVYNGSNTIITKESTQDRLVVKYIKEYAKPYVNKIYDCTVDNGTSQNDILNKLVAKHNGVNADINLSIHFNSGAKDERGNGRTTGVEVLVYNPNASNPEADRICKSIEKRGFKNRGLKDGSGKAVIRKTKKKMLLVECCFLDDLDDIKIYDAKRMAKAIVEGLFDVKIDEDVATPPVSQTYENAIIYSGDRDKAVAIIMKEYLPRSTIIDIADYTGHTTNNVYTVGGGASNSIDKFGGHVTKFVGNDFKETYRKVVEWLEGRKYM
ncbi:N-acetylmuramoyl-L-alanine amidase [Metaclostridioides mangenotii]|uniref:N-acetylmuramoyl-L-alanine amidase n=1 Tax=Metaclostridioides mangenotii TaxID=1540 RepID=UPI0004651C9F|nr:N-acetylmuramoyl-L-alanine amidase [Clostridioides mangenotii]